MKIDKCTSLGILFIIIAMILFFTDFFSPFIRPLTHLFLMGSSKGKDILFFLVLGMLLIFSQLFEYNSKFTENEHIKKILSSKIGLIFKLKNNTYLKISLILILGTSILGFILEIIMRYQMEISPFTIFVIMEPTVTTTSIIHSHIYKSVLGGIINSIISIISLEVPLGINTGDSLYQYVPQLTNIIIIILPLLFLTLLASLKNRLGPSRLLLIFASAVGLIGIFDGSLFSLPCAGGIYGILLIYFDETGFDYYTAKLFKNKYIIEKKSDDIKAVWKQKSISYEAFKRLMPHIFLISIILLGFSVSIIGSNTEHYEVKIIKQNTTINDLNNSLSNYSVISIQKQDFDTLIYIYPEYNEMELLNSLIKSLKGKANVFSMSWDFFSYLKMNNANLTKSIEL